MRNMASRLAGRGESGDPIRDDTEDRDVHRLQREKYFRVN